MRIRFVRRLVSMGALVGASLLANVAAAAVPGTITHQGRLFDAAGAPVSSTLDVIFTIYDAADAGKVIWTETHSVAFDSGYFSVNLGETKEFGDAVFDGSPRYIGITIGGDDEMKPRARIGSVPYALVAGDVRGDINPTSVSIEGFGTVIDANGQWMGDTTGLAGPEGPQGPAGPAGAPGPAGAQGPMGPAGAQGTPGPAGPQGIPGVAGPAGAQGAPGPAGAAGAQGPTGAMGPAGPAGPAGAQGAQGVTGAMGPAGPAGPAGAQGVAGPAGPQGPAGALGPTGATGAMGPAGPQGVAGPVGPMGPMGPAGPAGATGVAGPVGPMGPMGPAGPAGSTGATGATGAAGTSGFLASSYVNGGGAGPLDSANQTYAFIGVTASVNVAGPAQAVFVSATKALGSTMGATGLSLSICRRAAGSAAAPTDNGFDFLDGLSVGPNQKLPFTLSTRFTGLAAGSYEFGLCGYTTPGQAVNWNNNDWTRVTLILAQ